MPRVRFIADHVAVPHPAQSILYKAGETHLVSQIAAADAVRLGRGVIVPSPGERISEPQTRRETAI